MISVIIVSYMTGGVLFSSIETALGQDGVGDVLLVDNGNPAMDEERLDALASAEERLTVLRGQGNVGFAAACNLGAAHARGRYCLFLNPDALLPEGAAVKLAEAGEGSGAEHWVTGPVLLNPDGTEQQGSRRQILTPWNAFVEATKLWKLAPQHPAFRRFNDHEAPPLQRSTVVPCLSGACFLVPRGTWDELGGMDQRFFLHVEDIDFFLRLNKLGGLAIAVPEVGVVHHKSSSQVDPLFVEKRKKQSMNLYFDTHFKGVYPKGFLSLLRGLLWTSFSFRKLKLLLKRG
ncbi:glycosyltransferase [Parvularcula maris]|uniref:Glycosyltransferase family 2 protein n=1 Tax=Parvularcula maris TaxID=2965077 RepID=A0A9X2L747_9PROT|nr:glycosyltransferase family 2 protein [Parvularcula maris]